jgi:hypothetical protein
LAPIGDVVLTLATIPAGVASYSLFERIEIVRLLHVGSAVGKTPATRFIGVACTVIAWQKAAGILYSLPFSYERADQQ